MLHDPRPLKLVKNAFTLKELLQIHQRLVIVGVGGRQAGSVKLLIEAGADVNAKDSFGTALDQAENLMEIRRRKQQRLGADDPLLARDPSHNIDKIIDLLKAAGAKHGNEL